MSTPAARPRSQIWILVGVFFAPLALAFLLYYGSRRLASPRQHQSRRADLTAAAPAERRAAHASRGSPLPATAWHGKWTLVYVGDGRCDERCRAALTLMRQTRLALNTDMTRVQRIFLATGNCCDRAYLDAEHPGLAIALADNDAGAALLAAFPDATGETARSTSSIRWAT